MKTPSKTILQDDTSIIPPDPPNGVIGVSGVVCNSGVSGFGVLGSSGVCGLSQSGFRSHGGCTVVSQSDPDPSISHPVSPDPSSGSVL